MGDYPEHERLQAAQAESQAAGEFIEHLTDQGIFLARYIDGRNFLRKVPESLTELLANWQGIDLVKLEDEKRQMLANLRTASEGSEG